jgi:mannose-6-phosphate isomerase-like protein (cupin superfamily)
MRPLVLALFLVLAAALVAADPSGFAYWSGAELRSYSQQLAPKLTAQKPASQDLGKFGDHSFSVTLRQTSGEAELHENVADVFVVQGGEATLAVGGKVVGGKTTAPGEIRGTSVQGGVTRKLVSGDVVHIPAKTPHQLLLAPGQQFTYFVIKIQ